MDPTDAAPTPMDGYPTAVLLREVRSHGYRFTERQLTSWVRVGLVDRPDRTVRRGRGRGAGRHPARYTGNALDRVVRICELLKLDNRGTRRRISLPQVGWELWVRGDRIPASLIRTALGKSVAELKRELERQEAPLRATGAPQGTASDQLVELAIRGTSPPLRAARARVNTRGRRAVTRFLPFLEVLYRLFRDFGGWRPSPREVALLEEGLGVTRGREPVLPGTPPLVQGGIMDSLIQARQTMQFTELVDAIDATTDDDLPTALDELRRLLASVDLMRFFAAPMFGPDALGLGGLRPFDELLPDIQMVWLLVWLAVRRMPGTLDGYRRINAAYDEYAPLRESMQRWCAEQPGRRQQLDAALRADFAARWRAAGLEPPS